VKKWKSEKLLTLALKSFWLIYISSNFSKYFAVDVEGPWKLSILHTRLRHQCSSLNADLSKIFIINNFKCNCGASFEDAIHYFLECPLGLDSKLYQLIWSSLLTNYTHEVMKAKQNIDNRHLKFWHRKKVRSTSATISISILKICSLGTIRIVMTSTAKYLEKFELI
jgi:hypothetical protein